MTDDLRPVPLTDGPIAFRGALELLTTEAGVLPRRLPQWTVAQYPEPSMERQATAGSGVRLAFRTAATAIEIDVLTTVPWTPDAPQAPEHGGTFELTVDGAPAGVRNAPAGNVLKLDPDYQEGTIIPGVPSTLRFDGLPAADKDIEIWFSQWAKTEVRGIRADAPVTPPAPTGRRVWLHHGSSISACNEAETPLGTWPVIAARAAGVEPLNLGLSGNCFLDPFVARTIRDTEADLISLKLGINFTARAVYRLRTLGPTVHGFLDTIREGHPDTPILVVSPIGCPALERTPGPTVWRDEVFTATGDPATVAAGALTLEVVRRELRKVVEQRAKQDPNIHYLDGLRLLAVEEADELLGEGLHPNPAGYRVIGERFAQLAFGAGGALAAE